MAMHARMTQLDWSQLDDDERFFCVSTHTNKGDNIINSPVAKY